jgi:hypothetical protein
MKEDGTMPQVLKLPPWVESVRDWYHRTRRHLFRIEEFNLVLEHTWNAAQNELALHGLLDMTVYQPGSKERATVGLPYQEIEIRGPKLDFIGPPPYEAHYVNEDEYLATVSTAGQSAVYWFTTSATETPKAKHGYQAVWLANPQVKSDRIEIEVVPDSA